MFSTFSVLARLILTDFQGKSRPHNFNFNKFSFQVEVTTDTTTLPVAPGCPLLDLNTKCLLLPTLTHKGVRGPISRWRPQTPGTSPGSSTRPRPGWRDWSTTTPTLPFLQSQRRKVRTKVCNSAFCPAVAVDKRALLFLFFLRPFTFPAIEAMKAS